MNDNHELSYSAAMQRIQQILQNVENPKSDLDIDSLTKDVEEAANLINFCKTKLFSTEAKIQKVLETLENEEPSK